MRPQRFTARYDGLKMNPQAHEKPPYIPAFGKIAKIVTTPWGITAILDRTCNLT
jgi:hypothetical protein